MKSDKDERILADFDNKAAPAARRLISLSRTWIENKEATSIFLQMTSRCGRRPSSYKPAEPGIPGQSGLSEDKSGLYLDLYLELARVRGQRLPPRGRTLKDPRVRNLFGVLTQNQRANFASANHPILAKNEREFLAHAA